LDFHGRKSLLDFNEKVWQGSLASSGTRLNLLLYRKIGLPAEDPLATARLRFENRGSQRLSIAAEQSSNSISWIPTHRALKF
jgi:hypothetical protein